MLSLLKKSIANSFTMLNLLLGFSAIILVALSFSEHTNYIQTACILIYIAALIDVFDGKIARKLGTTGDFGKEIDSLADLVSFCLLPAVLIFYYYYDPYNSENMNLKFGYLIILSSLPLLCGAIRLAKFNAYDEHSKDSSYLGLPTPGNALFICSIICLMDSLFMQPLSFIDKIVNHESFSQLINMPNTSFFQKISILSYKILFSSYYIPLFACSLSSILLISKIRYSKFPILKSKLGKENLYSIIGISIFFIILIVGVINKEHNSVILFFITYYIISGLFKWIIKLLNISKWR